MNCKQGDLAIIVRSGDFYQENLGKLGKLVTCVEFVGPMSMRYPPNNVVMLEPDVWRIEPALPAWDGKLTPFCADVVLKPVRDSGDDAVDEMLRPPIAA